MTMNFNSHLDLEHQKIEKAATELSTIFKKETKSDQDRQRATDLLIFFDEYVLQLHFSKEEQIFFPEVRNLAIDQLGGPKCGACFGKYERHKDADFLTVCGKSSSIPEYKFSQTLLTLLDGRWSGLRIPLSEHEVEPCHLLG